MTALHAAGLAWLANLPVHVGKAPEWMRMHVRTIEEIAPPPPAPPPKPVVRPRVRPVVPQVPAPSPPERIPEPALETPPSAPVLATSPQAEPLVAVAPPVPPPVTDPEPTTPARFDADYLRNPPPVYPLLSRRLGEQGRVLLLVTVSASGGAVQIKLKQSSGFERLDVAAQEAVRNWRFVPARRGDEAIEASVIVPVLFRLDG